jgi:nitronate monooxygenase
MPLLSIPGLEPPVIQAPMAGVPDSALALAVCEAGGLGSLPAAMLAPDDLARQLALLAAGRARPWNVNFFAHTPPPPDPAREAAWGRALRRITANPASPPTPAASRSTHRQRDCSNASSRPSSVSISACQPATCWPR